MADGSQMIHDQVSDPAVTHGRLLRPSSEGLRLPRLDWRLGACAEVAGVSLLVGPFGRASA